MLFVPLADLADARLILPAVAAALGVSADHDTDLPHRLGEALRSRDVLLVLDNFEHLLAAAETVGRLARTASGVLVTSRSPLNVGGERVYPVHPLAIHEVNGAPPPAVTLFLERAQDCGADAFVLERDKDAVADICARLDGLPLAIELAAARTSVLSPTAIASRLGHRLSVAVSGASDVPARHRTLRASIEWSVDPLPEPERRLLSILSLFPAGATLDDLEAVGESDADTVVDRLTGLVAASVVQHQPGVTDDRYVLLQVIRGFAAGLLDAAPDATSLRRRYVRRFHQFLTGGRLRLPWPAAPASSWRGCARMFPTRGRRWNWLSSSTNSAATPTWSWS